MPNTAGDNRKFQKEIDKYYSSEFLEITPDEPTDKPYFDPADLEIS